MNNLYGILFVVQLILLVFCCIKSSKRKWICQLSLQGFSTAMAIVLLLYFDNIPVTSVGPIGVPYLSEVFSSMIFAVVYGVLLIIGALAAAIRWPRDE